MAFDIRSAGRVADMDGGGEQRLIDKLEHLPDDYVAIIGATLAFGRAQRSEQFDAIVIGPPGIFSFEVKNWSGRWHGDTIRWSRGTEQRPSPILGAREKRDYLMEWLRTQNAPFPFVPDGPYKGKLRYWVDYGIVLTHPQVDITRVSDPSKEKYTFYLEDLTHDVFMNKVYRDSWAQDVDGYYEARRIADLIAPAQSPDILAIDFGTSYSLVAMYTPEGSSHIFPDEFNNLLIPSLFGYQDRHEYVGRKAKNAIATDRLQSQNVVSSVKTYLGMSRFEFYDLSSRKKPSCETRYDDSKGLCFRLNGKWFTVVEVAGKILGYLRQIAERHTNRTWQQAVVSVPARFTHEQRSDIIEAARLAGFNKVFLIDEPTAAALAFGMIHQYDGTVAVYDLGGGTFDISVVEIHGGACAEKVKLGRLIGGDDFDYRLAMSTKSLFEQDHPGSMAHLKDRESFKLFQAAEQAKINLSGDQVADIFLENWRDCGDLRRAIARWEFEHLIGGFIDETIQLSQQALQEANIRKVDDVLLVGGSTFVPLVKGESGEVL